MDEGMFEWRDEEGCFVVLSIFHWGWVLLLYYIKRSNSLELWHSQSGIPSLGLSSDFSPLCDLKERLFPL